MESDWLRKCNFKATFWVSFQGAIAAWRNVFLITAGVYFFGNLIFMCFERGNLRLWNDPGWNVDNKSKSKIIFTKNQ